MRARRACPLRCRHVAAPDRVALVRGTIGSAHASRDSARARTRLGEMRSSCACPRRLRAATARLPAAPHHDARKQPAVDVRGRRRSRAVLRPARRRASPTTRSSATRTSRWATTSTCCSRARWPEVSQLLWFVSHRYALAVQPAPRPGQPPRRPAVPRVRGARPSSCPRGQRLHRDEPGPRRTLPRTRSSGRTARTAPTRPARSARPHLTTPTRIASSPSVARAWRQRSMPPSTSRAAVGPRWRRSCPAPTGSPSEHVRHARESTATRVHEIAEPLRPHARGRSSAGCQTPTSRRA